MKLKILLLKIFLVVFFVQAKSQTDTIHLKFLHADDYNNSKIQNLYFENSFFENDFADFPSYLIQKELLGGDVKLNCKLNIIKTTKISINAIPSAYKKYIGTDFKVFTEYYGNVGRIIIRPFKLLPAEDSLEILEVFTIEYQEQKVAMKGTKGRVYASNSVLNTGHWYKIRISKTGIYKITASEIASMGFNMSNVNLSNVKVFGNGGGMLAESNGTFRYDDLVENAIQVFDLNSNGIFDGNDYIIFYGTGANTWKYNTNSARFQHQIHLYDNYSYYYLTISSSTGKRVKKETTNQQGALIPINTYNDFAFYERDTLNLIKSGKVWFGEKFDLQTSYNFPFSFSSIDLTQRVKVKVSAAARSTAISNINYSIAGNSYSQVFDAIYPNYTSDYAYMKVDTFSFIPNSSNLNLFANYNKTTSSSIAWFDYAELNVISKLNMIGSQFSFRNQNTFSPGNTATYDVSQVGQNTVIWDVSNPLNPVEVDGVFSGNHFSFMRNADSLREFIAFTPSFLSVENVGVVQNQNLHALSKIDFVIVTHKDFIAEAQKLADFHIQRDSLNTIVIEQSQIYNEFSSGAVDVSAIRDFMKMLYDKAGSNLSDRPKYLLLFGDGSFDPKTRIVNNSNFIPTYQSEASLSPSNSYTSDDYFGLLDDNEGNYCDGAVDIGIGRIVCNSKQQAQEAVDKIFNYSNYTNVNNSNNSCTGSQTEAKNYGDWRNILAFIGDDQDGDIHVSQSDFLAEQLRINNPNFNVVKIFLDAYTQITTPGGQRYPDAKKDLLARVQKGAFLVNYTGHGGEVGWAHESILEVADILNWTNKNTLPCFVTATCEFSRFDDPMRTSAGEYVFLNTNGGGIALFTTTRLAYSGTNFDINRALINCAFPTNSKNYPRLGDIIKTSKVVSGSSYNNRNFVLIGDPALKLNYPSFDISTTSINENPITQTADTIKALEKVIIKGEVTRNGLKMTNFNGRIYPTVYDKVQQLTTLGNDQDSPPMAFNLQKNTLYKGIAEVKNGEFEFSFVVPKDILYAYGLGKISYYAENDSIDASGSFQSFVIGGSSSNANSDQIGPAIDLFMNDTNFVSGGITNENPNLLAYIFDENGVNTIGNGIGHDIVAILDNNSAKPIVLNDYYLSDINSYKSGKVKFPFSNLSEGNHNLSLKVWDVYNNSSNASINFVVKSASEMTLINLSNFPNPFSEETNFIFEHNQACEELDVTLEIYSTNGNLVFHNSTKVNSSGYKVGAGQLVWNGTGNGGESLSKGLYVYRISITSCDGSTASDVSKLLLVK